MQNIDEAWPSINPAGCGYLVKMLTTLEPHGIFYLNFAYIYILTLSGHSLVYKTVMRASVRPVVVS